MGHHGVLSASSTTSSWTNEAGVDHLGDLGQAPVAQAEITGGIKARLSNKHDAWAQALAAGTEKVFGCRLKDGMTGANQGAQTLRSCSRSDSTGCSSWATVDMAPPGCADPSGRDPWLERNPLNRGVGPTSGRSSCKFHGITCGHNPAGTEIWPSGGLLSVGEQRQGQINQSMGWINQFHIGWKQLAQHWAPAAVVAAAQDDRLNAGLQQWLEIAQCRLPQLGVSS